MYFWLWAVIFTNRDICINMPVFASRSPVVILQRLRDKWANRHDEADPLTIGEQRLVMKLS